MRRAGNHAMTGGNGRALARAPGLPGPERLVGLGFRYWLAGYRTGDITCWERAWCAYSGVMGAAAAKAAIGDLSSWVRAIKCHAERDLQTAATDCDRFCRDECMAIAMIAACQHQACPAMRSCAFALLGCSMIDEVVQGAENFAASMRGAEQILSPDMVHGMTLLAAPVTNSALH